MEEVLTEIQLELRPKSDGVRELAIDQECGKKTAERMGHPELDGVGEGLNPFLVILCEATGNTGVTKSRVKNPIVSAEVLIAGGARDGEEEETEVEAIASGWVGGVHTADGFGAVGT
jgi:hypothetical protein